MTCTCRTGHSNTTAWSSDEFIGQGGARLELASDDPLQTRRNVTNSSTFAVLTDSSDLSGVVVLTSFLSFAASRNSDNILICENVDLQSSYPIIVPMSSEYFVMVIIVIDVLAPSTCPYFLVTLCHVMYSTYIPHAHC